MGKHRGTISTRIWTESARQRIVETQKNISHFQTYRQSFNTKHIHGALMLFQVCRQCLTRHLESTLQDKDKKVINQLTKYTWNFRLCEIIARSWNNTFFCCLGYLLLFSRNNAVSCLGFWLLGNACQPDLFLRFLGGKLRFLDGKLRRFKCLSTPWWEVQVPQNVPKPKNARRQKKMQVPQKSNNFWKTKI